MPAQLLSKPSAARAWSRALELTAPIAASPHRILPVVIDELAGRFGDAQALLADDESLTYRELAARSNQYSRWAIAEGLRKGDSVCLLMPNRPEYLAAWLGITRVGGVMALLNTNLSGASLTHCIKLVAPLHLIVDATLVDSASRVREDLSGAPRIWVHGGSDGTFERVDLAVNDFAAGPLDVHERPAVTIDDRALYIYTSGTTGLPKAANVSHARLMQWSHWFAGMMDTSPSDRMYNCLPMYHSVGGVLATAAVLVGGGSVVIRKDFSARQFWSDVTRWNCTLVQYIGEFCRYLVRTEPNSTEKTHRVRIFCGNGLRPDVWQDFQARFAVPQIFEFYAATEGNVSLFNIEGKPGAIGRIPAYLAHRFPAALVQFDVASGQPVRNSDGRCIRAAPNEVGEAIGKILDDRSNVGGRFDGYTDPDASESKVLRDVFAAGDTWFRTGDLMRRDEKGFFYFVDRVGDTFRWKGENVSTSEVAEAISGFPGVSHAIVYGVAIPGADGRAGMAVVVADEALDLAALRAHLSAGLPAYAQPLFLRVSHALEATSTFKYTKADFVRQGFDPTTTTEPIYFNDRECQAYVRLDRSMFEQILSGAIRL